MGGERRRRDAVADRPQTLEVSQTIEVGGSSQRAGGGGRVGVGGGGGCGESHRGGTLRLAWPPYDQSPCRCADPIEYNNAQS